MNPLPSSWPGPVLTPDPTLQPAPQPGLVPLVPGLATPSSGPNASPPTMSIRENGASTEPVAVLTATQGDAGRSRVSVTASQPSFYDVPRGLSPLGQAAYTGEIEQVLTLIRQGCDVNVRETGEAHGYTPLLAAAENGHTAIVGALLAAGADVNLKNGEIRGTALMCAAVRGHESVVALLLQQAGIRRDDTRYPGNTAFDLAAANGRAAIAEMLFDAQLLAPGRRDELMASACRNGKIAIVKLLHRCCSVDLASLHDNGYLHISAFNGRTMVVAYLLGAGMDPDTKDRNGMTPLQAACKSGSAAVVDKLLEHAKVPYAVATAGLMPTPLHIAANEGHVTLLDYLLRAGADPNVMDVETGRTALMIAAQRGTIDTLRLLLACPRMQIDLVCNAGCTALELARAAHNRDAAIQLLGAGAKVDLRDSVRYHKSWLYWAIDREDGEMFGLLLKRMATAPAPDSSIWEDAMEHAVESECADIVECLMAADHAGSVPIALAKTIARSLGQKIKDVALLDFSVTTYKKQVRAIAIADLQIGCKPAASLWPVATAAQGVPAIAAPLQTLKELFEPIFGSNYNFDQRGGLLRKLYKGGLLMTVALPLTSWAGACGQGLQLLANVNRSVNPQQKSMYYAAALSMLNPQELSTTAVRIYAASGISANGVERLALAARSQFNDVQTLIDQANAVLGEQMLEQIMPACLKHTDGRYQVDVAGLVEVLVANGLMQPFAQALAARWNAAVGSLMAGPVAIPPGASFAQVAHILNDALRRLGQTHFGASLQLALREASLLTELRQMTSRAPTNEVLPMLFQIQADQLRQFAEQLQQG